MRLHNIALAMLRILFAVIIVLPGAACARAQAPTPGPTLNATAGPSPTPQPVSATEGPVRQYLAVAPRVLQAGQQEPISVALFNGSQPAAGTVAISLRQGSSTVAEAQGRIEGRGEVTLAVPRVPAGDYELHLTGTGFHAQSPVRVEETALVFVETDKPIYKPGQTAHLRVLTLDSDLRPVSLPVTLEVADAKGIKVFRREATTDDYGLLNADLPLSTEPNLGVWKATVQAAQGQSQLDFRVERYVLPKYEVNVDLAKDWALASEPITGTVSAEYAYGKPVSGEVEIVATRYVGQWEEYAHITRNLDGSTAFELPPVGYVAGVPEAGGQGNVQLTVTVREKSTGYEQKTTQLLTVAATPVVLRVIAESASFKPGLPLNLLVLAQTPDKKPADARVAVQVDYMDQDLGMTSETREVTVSGGKGRLQIIPPKGAISFTLNATSGEAYTSLVMTAGYSPTGSFINLEQTSQGDLKVGGTARFHVNATQEARHFYYEVLARGRVVFSGVSDSPDITLTLTPAMAPSARLLVYQILPNNEVAADFLPFDVTGDYPLAVQAGFDQPEVRPGAPVTVSVQTDGPARVGLAAVDRSVFILAENRLNLQQVFDQLEQLYMQPQAELHQAEPLTKITTYGASQVFAEAGVVVLSNQQVPQGQEYQLPQPKFEVLRGDVAVAGAAPEVEMAAPQAAAPAHANDEGGSLAEVQRVRQFFPETWLWSTVDTDPSGKATLPATAPDSITTWMLRAVALSKDKGLGISESQLRVLQPFFVQVDLPYSAIRGEQFPVQVALYNYTDSPQDFTVELAGADWFDLTGPATQTVTVGANDVASAQFTIRPQGLGTHQIKVTARSHSDADAIVKDLIVEPEGVAREAVDNLVVAAGKSQTIDLTIPQGVIEGSPRAYIGVTGSYLTQAMDGLEGLLRMPFGCGEQNMILFAPNVFVTQYLRETNQMKPEVMAKAESLMTTGYQRELIYRRADASFSAFGDQDEQGSLWLTAFVLKTFAQAKSLMYIDPAVLDGAKAWIIQHQNADGSFDPVGFIHHEDMLGGLKGKTALTAYVAIALREAGETEAAGRAIHYVEGALKPGDDVYTLALSAYALELAKSPAAAQAYDRLLKAAHEADGGLYWGDEIRPEPLPQANGGEAAPVLPPSNRSATIETTGYALLALTEHGDRMNASRAARWLVSQRNAYGGYGSTQDTVVGLQALTRFAAGNKADVDATVTLRSGSWQKELRVSPENVDVLQTVDAPVGGQVSVSVQGKGQVVLQAVRRYNVPEPKAKQNSAFQLDVQYGTQQVAVNDLIAITASVRFTPPKPMQAGMVVVDVAVPTGFSAEESTVQQAVQKNAKIKRYEIAGRKVVFYIEDLAPNEQIAFSFQARALYPVRAQAVTSDAYAYYQPELKGESLGGALTVR